MKKIIIIGSGLGGLLSGVLLARKGHRVKVYESHSTPGGYTAGFWRKGFYFESGTLAFESSGVFFRALQDAGIADKVRCVRKKDRWVTPYFDFRFDSYADFKETVRRSFPAEKEAVEDYFAGLDRIYVPMKSMAARPFPMQFNGFKALRAALPFVVSGIKQARILKRFGALNVEDIADVHFQKGTPLHRLFSRLGYPKMGIDGLAGFFASMADDYWHVADGMQHLADTLAARFVELGGELKCRAAVDRILTRNGAAVGVSSGEEKSEADFVISACDYKSTFLELLDDRSLLPPSDLDRIRKAEVSNGVFTVYLGLNMENEELDKNLRAYTLNYNPLEHDLDFDDPGDADHFRKSGFAIHALSLINPGLAPGGKSSLMIQALCPTRWQNNWHKGDREK